MADHSWLAPLVPAFETLATLIDLIGIAIILYGFTIALVQFLGAEFMIASDIIHTVISRELGDLVFVAALVAIRTAISYFLGKELEEARREGS